MTVLALIFRLTASLDLPPVLALSLTDRREGDGDLVGAGRERCDRLLQARSGDGDGARVGELDGDQDSTGPDLDLLDLDGCAPFFFGVLLGLCFFCGLLGDRRFFFALACARTSAGGCGARRCFSAFAL